jgi:hypothetical protein
MSKPACASFRKSTKRSWRWRPFGPGFRMSELFSPLSFAQFPASPFFFSFFPLFLFSFFFSFFPFARVTSEKRQREIFAADLEKARAMVEEEEEKVIEQRQKEQEATEEITQLTDDRRAIKAELEAAKKKLGDVTAEFKEIKARHDALLQEMGDLKKLITSKVPSFFSFLFVAFSWLFLLFFFFFFSGFQSGLLISSLSLLSFLSFLAGNNKRKAKS